MTPLVDIEIAFEEPAWEPLDLPCIAKSACLAGATAVGLNIPLQVSILASNDAHMAKLNAEFRDKDAATNVLSWPSEDLSAAPGSRPRAPQDPEIGDIARGRLRLREKRFMIMSLIWFFTVFCIFWAMIMYGTKMPQ